MIKLKSYTNSIKNLENALNEKKNEFTRDSAIKRFEISYDLAWKSIKEYAHQEGVECYSPRECLKTAFQLGLIENDEKWLQMVISRNEARHIYSEKLAEKLYKNLSNYLELFKHLEKAFTNQTT